MKSENRLRIAIAASAALGMVAMSSSASAQFGNFQDCARFADVVCSFDENYQPTQVTYECWLAQFEACMNAFASLDVAPIGDRRSEALLASSPAAAPRP
jgi:hypothetical protein